MLGLQFSFFWEVWSLGSGFRHSRRASVRFYGLGVWGRGWFKVWVLGHGFLGESESADVHDTKRTCREITG